MRILHVVRPAMGGMLNHIKSLLRELPGEFRQAVAGPDPMPFQPEFDAVPFYRLPLSGKLSFTQDPHSAFAMRRLLRTRAFDVVHVHGLKAAAIAALATRGSASVPLVVTLHNEVPHSDRFWHRLGLQYIMRAPNRIICVSRQIYGRLQALALCPKEQIICIPNGIPLASFPASHNTADRFIEPPQATWRERLGISPHDVVVIIVARLMKAKGLPELIEAVAALPPHVHLLVVGEGPDGEALRHQAKVRAPHRVHFLGFQSNVFAALASADIFALPSHSEGLPLTVLEAMATGLPVVATSVGGIPEVVVDGQTGFLIPPHAVEPLKHAIDRLVADPELRAKFGRAGAAMVAQAHSDTHMAAKVADVYRQVAPSGANPTLRKSHGFG